VSSSEESLTDGVESGRGGQTPAADDNASELRNAQTGAIQSQQDKLAAATRSFGAVDPAVAPTPSRNIAKPLDLSSPQPGGEQFGFSPGSNSLSNALRPVQPNMQTWLDNWLGPRGRAIEGARENSDTSAAADIQQPSMQDFPVPTLPSGTPEMQPAELETPEQIAQRYDDIKVWLDANTGIEPGIDGASLPERNPFAFAGAGSVGDIGNVSMPWFGRTPGMAVLGGQELVPLRGINDGYTLLGGM
jgi:hypothetical protein